MESQAVSKRGDLRDADHVDHVHVCEPGGETPNELGTDPPALEVRQDLEQAAPSTHFPVDRLPKVLTSDRNARPQTSRNANSGAQRLTGRNEITAQAGGCS